MSTEQEDAVLLLELEEKITCRIREQIRLMADGVAAAPSVPMQVHPSLLDPGAMYRALLQNVRHSLLNDTYFVTEMTKRIGQRMSQMY